jgi:hypothetical protein
VGGPVELIGTVVRLQVQRSRLKPGPRGARRYDPTPLRAVAALDVTPRGVVGDGIVDVHHADHPDSRFRGDNGLSVMTLGGYAALRERYGEHLVDGVAGESLLLDTTRSADLTGPLVLDTGDGLLELTGQVAEPCVEFTRFVLRRPVGDAGPEVRAALGALGGGARGYYLATAGTARVTAGARLLRP